MPFLSRKVVGQALEIVTVVSEMLKPRIAMERENIYEVEDIGQEMYVIIYGQVTLHDRMVEGTTASYHRVLNGFTDAKSKENALYYEQLTSMTMPQLRRESLRKGISPVKWKRQETLAEICAELATMPLRSVEGFCGGTDLEQGLFERAIDDGVQTAKVQLVLEPDRYELIKDDVGDDGWVIQEVGTGMIKRITDRSNDEHWSDTAQQIKAKCAEAGSSDATTKELLIDLIMHFTEFVLRDVKMAVAIKSEQLSFEVLEPIQGDDNKEFDKARAEIINEISRSSGAIFGERELFFSRREFTTASLHTYRVAGREYKRLPLVARKRHQTATITSSKKAELMWMKWSDGTH